MTLKAFLLAVTLIASLTLNLSSAPAATLPVIDEGGGPGHGWVALKFYTNGAHATVTIEAPFAGIPGSATAMGIRENGSVSGASQALVVAAAGGVFVQSEPTPGVGVDFSSPTITGGGFGAGVTYRYNDPADGPQKAGTHRLLLFTTGRSGSWRWALQGDPGVELLGMDTGNRTMSFTSADFKGLAAAGGYVYGVGGRVHLEAEKRLSAEDGFGGVFMRLPTGNVTFLEMTPPTGSLRQCDCTFGPNDFGAGEYVFNLTGVGAGLSNFQEVFLGVADARLVL